MSGDSVDTAARGVLSQLEARFNEHDERVNRIDKQLEEVRLFIANFMVSQDETDHDDVCVDCEALQAKRDFIESYIIAKAPTAAEVREWNLSPADAARDTMTMAVAYWDAIQQETED